MRITIERLDDQHDCDTCGYSFAYGAIIRFDGKVVISMIPEAHCYAGKDYTDDMVFEAIFYKLGHTLEYV